MTMLGTAENLKLVARGIDRRERANHHPGGRRTGLSASIHALIAEARRLPEEAASDAPRQGAVAFPTERRLLRRWSDRIREARENGAHPRRLPD